jgi:hypothetical protein
MFGNFSPAAGRVCIGVQNGKLLLCESLGSARERVHRVTAKEEFEVDVADPSHF